MNEQKKPKMFKTVFGGGYQKNDVNAYIETMQAQFQSVEATLKNTINHQRTELDDLRQQMDEVMAANEMTEELQLSLETASAELTAVKAELEPLRVACIAAESGKATAEASLAAARDEAALLTAERDAAKEELAALRAQYEALLAEKQELEIKYSEAVEQQAEEPAADVSAEEMPASNTSSEDMPVTNPVLSADYEAMKLKAEQFDRMSAHIGAIMLKANADAEDTMKQAKAEADAMVADVNRTLSETRERTQSSADHLIEDISKSLSEISRGCREEIVLDLDELRVALRTLETVVENKYAEINRKLDYTKDEMEQAAGAIIQSATTPVVLDIESNA